jgi:hypothetical protein
MNGRVKEDFERGRKHLDYIKRVLGQYLISEAPFKEDVQHNTDLIVLTLKPYRIACRVRTYEYFERYPKEFTIRSSRPSGVETELQKMLSGWGDYIFYGFENKDNSSLCAWILGDLDIFRLYVKSYSEDHGGKLPGVEIPNFDESSKFRAFRLVNIPVNFLLAQKQAPVVMPDIDLYRSRRSAKPTPKTEPSLFEVSS